MALYTSAKVVYENRKILMKYQEYKLGARDVPGFDDYILCSAIVVDNFE